MHGDTIHTHTHSKHMHGDTIHTHPHIHHEHKHRHSDLHTHTHLETQTRTHAQTNTLAHIHTWLICTHTRTHTRIHKTLFFSCVTADIGEEVRVENKCTAPRWLL